MSQLETGEFGAAAGRRQLEEDYARSEQVYGREEPFRGVADQPAAREEEDEGLEPADGAHEGMNISEMERLISVAAGAGLATVGLIRGRLDGLVLAALGGALVWRGYSGRCQCYAALGINTAEHNRVTAVPAKQGEKVEKTITICRRPEEIYQFWRRFANLPRVMKNLERVEQIDSQRSHWIAKGPLGVKVEWDAEIHNERENELIAWRSLPGGDIQTAGSVHFKPSTREGCTDVTLSMKYNPPGGKVAAHIAEWLGDGLEQKLDEDLNQLKQVMESDSAPWSGGEFASAPANTAHATI